MCKKLIDIGEEQGKAQDFVPRYAPQDSALYTVEKGEAKYLCTGFVTMFYAKIALTRHYARGSLRKFHQHFFRLNTA